MTRATRLRALFALAVIALSLYIALTDPAASASICAAAPRSCSRPRTPSPSRRTGSPPNGPWRCCAGAWTRSASPNRPSPGPARTGSSSNCLGVQDPREAAAVLGRTAQLTFHPVLGTPIRTHRQPSRSRKGPSGTLSLPDESGQQLASARPGSPARASRARRRQLDPAERRRWFVPWTSTGQARTWARLTGEGRLRPGGRPQPAGRHRPRRQGHLLATGRPERRLQRRHRRRIHADHRQLHRRRGPRTGAAHQRRRPARTRRDRRTAHRRPDARRRPPSRPAPGPPSSARPYRTVHHCRVPAARRPRRRRPGRVRAHLVRRPGRPRRHPHPARPRRVRPRHRHGRGRQRAGLRTAREEYAAAGRSLRSALTAGFRNALQRHRRLQRHHPDRRRAAVLPRLRTGPRLRGHARRSVCSRRCSRALVIARVLAEFASRREVAAHPHVTGIANPGRVRDLAHRREPGPDAPRAPLARRLRGRLVLPRPPASLVRGLDFGVEFTGGRLVEYSTSRPVDAERRPRRPSPSADSRDAVVQASGDGDLTVRTGTSPTTGDKIRDRRSPKRAATTDEGPRRTDRPQPRRRTAAQRAHRARRRPGRTTALSGDPVPLDVRPSAVAAMAHDVIILVGAFAWLGKPVDGMFLAALLTVIGYSVNDSVVVFDRVRELWARRTPRRCRSAQSPTAASCRPCRAPSTPALGAMFILAALAVLGGDSLDGLRARPAHRHRPSAPTPRCSRPRHWPSSWTRVERRRVCRPDSAVRRHRA